VFDFTILRRGVWAGHPKLHAMCKEELPRGGFVELAPIVALDTLDLVAELSTDKREELSNTKKSVRLQTQRKSPGIVQKIIKYNKIIFRTQNANNWRCPNVTIN
jgi:hypothetical protein